ncbi:MAG TPA: guanylate kinase, partial [Nitrospira sp.]|nr:guanylate kinase [Nitrospira sp.]HNO34802.1 guanylate kinase [Nitrospira sp.]
DVQGARSVKKKFEDGVYIFILPPSFDTLRTRLQNRAGDSPEEIQRRLQKAKEEVWSYREYYYIVRNDDLKQSLKELESIFLAERTKTKRLNMTWLEEKFILDKEGKPGHNAQAPASKEQSNHG